VLKSDIELDRVRRLHRLRSFRIGSVLRVGVLALVLAAIFVGTSRTEWPKQEALLAWYAFATLCAPILAFSPVRLSVAARLPRRAAPGPCGRATGIFC
jgi:two-component system NarL family sensor kinase